MSPFRSAAQRAWLYQHHPDIAKRWEAETPEGAKLPEHARKEPEPPKRPVRRRRTKR